MQHRVKRIPSRNKLAESAEIAMNPARLRHLAASSFKDFVVKKSHA
jgi:hypothetical protein